jgi:hypothetical protein
VSVPAEGQVIPLIAPSAPQPTPVLPPPAVSVPGREGGAIPLAPTASLDTLFADVSLAAARGVQAGAAPVPAPRGRGVPRVAMRASTSAMTAALNSMFRGIDFARA